jgi:hypothetical protein
MRLRHERLITADDKFTGGGQLVVPIAVLPHSDGNDEQSYSRFGLNVLTSQATTFGTALDAPSTRIEPIAHPFQVRAFSRGHPVALPFVLMGMNLTKLFLVTLITTRLARRHGLPLWLTLAPVSYPGFELTPLLDTPEITVIAVGISALSFATQRQY